MQSTNTSTISTSPFTSTILSNSNAELAFIHFQDAFQTLNHLRTNLFDYSNTIPNSLSDIIHDIGDFYPSLDNTLLLSTLHGSLYDSSEIFESLSTFSTNTDIIDHTMENDNIENPQGSTLPNHINNPFENASNIIDLTNDNESDNICDNNVISIVDDRKETEAVRNVIVSHMNQTMEFVPDERNVLRTIRKRIRETVNKHSEDLLTFMIKPMDDLPIVSKLKRISNRLSSPNFNPSASWISNDLISFVNDDRMCETIEHDIGTSYSNLSNQIKNLHNSYQSTINSMMQLSESIDKKLNMIDIILSSLKSLPNISESNPSSLSLYNSIYDYVKYEMECCNIEKDYKEFIHLYGMFQKYRNLLQLAQSSYVGVSETQKPPGSICNICMTDNISFALVPCGHTFCTNCTNRTRHSCFVCRSNISQKLKIYIH